MWITFKFSDGITTEMYNLKYADSIYIIDNTIQIIFNTLGWDISYRKEELENFEEIKEKLMEL